MGLAKKLRRVPCETILRAELAASNDANNGGYSERFKHVASNGAQYGSPGRVPNARERTADRAHR